MATTQRDRGYASSPGVTTIGTCRARRILAAVEPMKSRRGGASRLEPSIRRSPSSRSSPSTAASMVAPSATTAGTSDPSGSADFADSSVPKACSVAAATPCSPCSSSATSETNRSGAPVALLARNAVSSSRAAPRPAPMAHVTVRTPSAAHYGSNTSSRLPMFGSFGLSAAGRQSWDARAQVRSQRIAGLLPAVSTDDHGVVAGCPGCRARTRTDERGCGSPSSGWCHAHTDVRVGPSAWPR